MDENPNTMDEIPNTMKYYLNKYLLDTNKEQKEFKKRAKELGFKGRSIYLDKISKSYIKFFNKKFKEIYNLKYSPIKNGKLTKPAKKIDEEGGYYLMSLNNFFQNKQPINIKINNKMNLKLLLEKALLKNQDMILTYTLSNGSKKAYTVNKNNIRKLQDIFIYEKEDSGETESDLDFKTLITMNTITNIEISPPLKKKKSSGAFFKYTHNIPDLDLRDLQIYNNVSEISSEIPCCFIQSLISGGLSDFLVDKAKNIIKCRDIPTCKLNELSLKLHIHFTINKVIDNKVIHYPTGKGELVDYIREIEPIKIGLIDEHYFHIKKLPITSYAINNYQDINHLKDYHKIYKKTPNGLYKKSNDRFISSYEIVKLLTNDRKKHLTPISLCNEIYSTNYFDMFDSIQSLEYSEDNIRPVEYKPKQDRDAHVNIFADFETTTDNEKHIPYCLHICSKELNIRKTFIGTDCAKQALFALSKLNINIRFIFHNAGYDIRFLFPHLTHYQPIERGKFLLRAYAKFYYGKALFYKIQIQDSYALIPEPLRKFKEMFNLVIKKEILPYGLYTQANVEKGLIPISDCIKAVEEQYVKNNIGKEICLEEQKQFVNEYLKNVKKWNCNIDNKIDIIRYSCKYCKMDCEVLEQGYNIFRNNLLEITDGAIDINLYVSVASLSLDYMKIKGVFDDVYELSGNPREFINKCMYGGRTMCSENKKIDNIIDKILADFDAVSLYPSAMWRLAGYLKGTPKVIDKDNLKYENIKNYDGYFVEIMIEKVNKKYKFPLMSKITKDGIRDWTNEMDNEIFYCDKITLEEVIKYHQIDFKIIRGYYYNEGRNMNLKPTIEHLFKTRLEAKKQKNPIEKIYKLLMNSCYGKCLLKPIDTEYKYISNSKYKEFLSANYNWVKEADFCKESNTWRVKLIKAINEHYNLVHCGVEVLSMSKRIMNEVMCLSEELGIDMYYTDTDSIHIDNSKIDYLATEFKNKYDRDLIGKNMGQFHSDFDSDILEGDITAKRSIFLGKKCYIDELIGSESGDKIDYHIRLKGIPNSSILDYAFNNKITPYEIYEKLLNKEEILFDMTCGGKKINFKFNRDMTISTLDEFSRNISFQ